MAVGCTLILQVKCFDFYFMSKMSILFFSSLCFITSQNGVLPCFCSFSISETVILSFVFPDLFIGSFIWMRVHFSLKAYTFSYCLLQYPKLLESTVCLLTYLLVPTDHLSSMPNSPVCLATTAVLSCFLCLSCYFMLSLVCKFQPK